MNNENLLKKDDRTPSERRENARKAGKASGEARRRRKTLREELLLMLDDDQVQERICVALLKEAMAGNRAGSVTKAFETIRDTIGEKPAEQIDLEGGIRFNFSKDDEDYSG